MDAFKRASDSAASMWNSLSGRYKFSVGLLAVVATIALYAISNGVSGDGMVRIAGSEKRDPILQKLNEKKVRHEVRADGVYVARSAAESVIVDLAGVGAVTDEMMSEFLKASDIFASNWDREKKYQVLLQRKLENMIRRFDGVHNASAQLTPETGTKGFAFKGTKARAAVQLELKPGAVITRENAAAIIGLVSGAVPGLGHDGVHLMDTQGRVYRVTRPSVGNVGFDRRDLEERYEKAKREDIERLLEREYPGVTAVVSVTAGSKDRAITAEQHGRSTPREEEKRSNLEPGSAPPQGIKGIQEPPGTEPARGGATQSESKVKHAVDKTVTTETDPAGQIEKITVSLTLPVEVADEKDPKEMREKEKGRDGICNRVAKAVGAPATSDDVSVGFVATRRPGPLPPPPAWEQEIFAVLREQPWTFAGGVAAFVLLILFYSALKRAFPKGAPGDRDVRAFEEVALETAGEGVLEEEDIGRLKRRVGETASRDPRAAAGVLKRWLLGR